MTEDRKVAIKQRIAMLKELMCDKMLQLKSAENNIKELEKDASSIGGAIQDCQYWLDTMLQEKKTATTYDLTPEQIKQAIALAQEKGPEKQ